MNHEFNGTNAIDSVAVSQSTQIGVALEKTVIIFTQNDFDRVDVSVPNLYFEKEEDDVDFYGIESNHVFLQQIAFSPKISKYGCLLSVLVGNHVMLYKQIGTWRCEDTINRYIQDQNEINTNEVIDSAEMQTIMINAMAWSGAFSSLDSIYKHAYLAVANDLALIIYLVNEYEVEYKFQINADNIRSIAWSSYDIEETGFTFVAVGTISGEFIVFRLDYPDLSFNQVFSFKVSSCVDLCQWYSPNQQNQVVCFTHSSKVSMFRLIANQKRNQFSEITHAQLPISRNPTILFTTNESAVVGTIGYLKEHAYSDPLDRFNHDAVVLKMKEKLLQLFNSAHVENFEEESDLTVNVNCYLSGCRLLGSQLYCHYAIRDPLNQELLQPNTRRSYMSVIPIQIENWADFDVFMSSTTNAMPELVDYSHKLQEFKDATHADVNDFSGLKQMLYSNGLPDKTAISTSLFDKRPELNIFCSLRKAILHFLHYKRKSVYLLNRLVFDDEVLEETRETALINALDIIEQRYVQMLGQWLSLNETQILEMDLEDEDHLFIGTVIKATPKIKYNLLNKIPKMSEICPITGQGLEFDNFKFAHSEDSILWDRCQVTFQIVVGEHFKCTGCGSYRLIKDNNGFLCQLLQCFEECLRCHSNMKAVLRSNALSR